jgi:alpha-glucosidase
MKDFGYDVSDYTAVDPMFGTLSDFDGVVAAARERGLRIMIDMVMSHTSDQHPWFAESRLNRTNPRADWYVWADPKPDGTPPNNWLSVFGGSAWQWDTRRCQYYLHNFLASQPDLNFHNPEVVEAMLDQLRFWLERGVQGVRLDAINFAFHDPELRDNPPVEGSRQSRVASAENPYSFQQHRYDKSQPQMLDLLRRIRALADEYEDVVLMGEIGDDHGTELMAQYTSGGDKLHMAYSFDLLTEESDAAFLRRTVSELERVIEDGYPCWSVGNHDVQRVRTRWGRNAAPERVAPLYAALVGSLRGGVCLYQGDELGLDEAQLGFEDLQDPYGIALWPNFKGRDGCRTPMPWQSDQPNAGFTAGRPWLPVPESHRALAVDRQQADPASPLNRVRAFLAWRRTQPALRYGDLQFLEAAGEVLLFERRTGAEAVLCAFNLGAEPVEIELPDGRRPDALDGHGFGGRQRGGTLDLPPYDAYFGRMAG